MSGATATDNQSYYGRSSSLQPTAAWEVGAIVTLVTVAVAIIATTIYEKRRRRRRRMQRLLAAETGVVVVVETVEAGALQAGAAVPERKDEKQGGTLISGPGRPPSLSRPERAMSREHARYYWVPQ